MLTEEQRDDIADILQDVARDGLRKPRDLDVALDAIQCTLFPEPEDEPHISTCLILNDARVSISDGVQTITLQITRNGVRQLADELHKMWTLMNDGDDEDDN